LKSTIRMNINQTYIVGIFILTVAVFISTLVTKEQFSGGYIQPPGVTIAKTVIIIVFFIIALIMGAYMLINRNSENIRSRF